MRSLRRHTAETERSELLQKLPQKAKIKAQRSGFDFERKKEGADAQFSAPCGGNEAQRASSKTPEKNKIKAQRSGFDFERKKEGADAQWV